MFQTQMIIYITVFGQYQNKLSRGGIMKTLLLILTFLSSITAFAGFSKSDYKKTLKELDYYSRCLSIKVFGVSEKFEVPGMTLYDKGYDVSFEDITRERLIEMGHKNKGEQTIEDVFYSDPPTWAVFELSNYEGRQEKIIVTGINYAYRTKIMKKVVQTFNGYIYRSAKLGQKEVKKPFFRLTRLKNGDEWVLYGGIYKGILDIAKSLCKYNQY